MSNHFNSICNMYLNELVLSKCELFFTASKIPCKLEYLLVEVFNTLFIGGDTVMRSLYPRKDKVRDLSSAESDSSRKLDFHIVRLLENGSKDKN